MAAEDEASERGTSLSCPHAVKIDPGVNGYLPGCNAPGPSPIELGKWRRLLLARGASQWSRDLERLRRLGC